MYSKTLAVLRTVGPHWGHIRLGALSALLVCLQLTAPVQAQSLYSQHVHGCSDIARRFLQAGQLADGSFPADGFLIHPVAITAAATFALLTTGSAATDPDIRLSMSYLRKQADTELQRINELALVSLVLTSVHDPDDSERLDQLTHKLVAAQLKSGSWPPLAGETDGNLSDTEFALLALRESSLSGIRVPEQVWQRSTEFWQATQLADGGWPEFYRETDRPTDLPVSSISGTLAGVAMLSLCEHQISASRPPATGAACLPPPISSSLKQGKLWLEKNCISGTKAGREFPLEHLCGIERMLRRQGELFKGEEELFRSGAVSLIERQHHSRGYWPGNNLTIATAYALIALMSGASPSLMNPIVLQDHEQPGARLPQPQAVWALNSHYRRRFAPPTFDHPHEVSLTAISSGEGLNDEFLQAPALFLSGNQAPVLTQKEFDLLQRYLNEGGLLLASPSCGSVEFDVGFRKLVQRLAAPLDGHLTPLPAFHPAYRGPSPLTSEQLEVLQWNPGCRTSILYVPHDLAFGWNQSEAVADTEPVKAANRIATQFGCNVMDWLSRTRPGNELRQERADSQTASPIETRGRVQLAVVEKQGSGTIAPAAITHLIEAANQTLGDVLALHPIPLLLDDPGLYQYPVLYWHGSQAFQLSDSERMSLRNHLDRGAVLIVDACCRSTEFDISFRRAMQQLYTETALTSIPVRHEMLSERTAFDLREVKIRRYEEAPAPGTIQLQNRTEPPQLEGIEQSGRYVVIYSPLDLSCAMGQMRRSECEGYLPADALRIATNLIVYSLLQDLKAIPRSR